MRTVSPHNLTDVMRSQEAKERLREIRARQRGGVTTELQSVATSDRSSNPLRPDTFDGVIGQTVAKRVLRRVVERARQTGQPMDHMLLVGGAGTGKSTLSHVVAHELGVTVYEVQAPISFDTLDALRQTMQDGDVLRIEEIHLQAIQERRGKVAATQPEVLFAVMEDHVLQTPQGVLPFPRITIVGTTTDEGMLPDSFISRFPLRPHLESYTLEDMTTIARHNAQALDLSLTDDAARMLARASRRVPRQLNNYVRNCAVMSENGHVDQVLAYTVLREVNGVTLDGLTPDMQNMLTFLFTRGRTTKGDGSVVYQASVNTIATALGKSRDTKAVNLRVEPFLIENGWVQVGSRGRILTDAGVERATDLVVNNR